MAVTPKQFLANLQDRNWRLRHLYYIRSKDGRTIAFRPNSAQERYLSRSNRWNIILKARQLGFTTLANILALDAAIFEGAKCGFISETKEKAEELFRDKIQFAFDRLPKSLLDTVKVIENSQGNLIFEGGGGICVGVTLRSGTYQFVHVSEFGKICATDPRRAKEIVTGSFPTLPPDGTLMVESTAFGAAGYFYDYCKAAQDIVSAGRAAGDKEFTFHFEPWWTAPEYVANPDNVIFLGRHKDYFADVERKIGRRLTIAQKAWYVLEERIQGDEMKREYPSFPDEAFHVAIEGVYYATELRDARDQRRICDVPIDPSYPVDTWWDLGIGDYTSIWFSQTIGAKVHLVDYYENCHEGFQHYAEVLRKRSEERKYRYGQHTGPHDINHREWLTGQTRVQNIAERWGIKFRVSKRYSVQDGITQVRAILPVCWFDQTRCAEGIVHLENYRKDWNEQLACWRDAPRHDEHSHCADGFRVLAVGHEFGAGVLGSSAVVAAPVNPLVVGMV